MTYRDLQTPATPPQCDFCHLDVLRIASRRVRDLRHVPSTCRSWCLCSVRIRRPGCDSFAQSSCVASGFARSSFANMAKAALMGCSSRAYDNHDDAAPQAQRASAMGGFTQFILASTLSRCPVFRSPSRGLCSERYGDIVDVSHKARTRVRVVEGTPVLRSEPEAWEAQSQYNSARTRHCRCIVFNEGEIETTRSPSSGSCLPQLDSV